MIEHDEKVKLIEFIDTRNQDFSIIESIFVRELSFDKKFSSFKEFYDLISDQSESINYLFNIYKNIKRSSFFSRQITKNFKYPFEILIGKIKFANINLEKLNKYELAFSIVSCITFHINKANKTRYLYHFDSLLTKNVCDFILFEQDNNDFVMVKNAIKRLDNDFNIGFKNFCDNYNGKHYISSPSFEKMIKAIFSKKDAFHYFHKPLRKTLYFNEKIIYDSFSISINSEGKLVPLMSIGNSKFPHYDFETKFLLPKLINDFSNFDYCCAVLELIYFLTDRENISEKSVSLFIDKYSNSLTKYDSYQNESMLNLFCCLISEKKMTQKSLQEFKNKILPILAKSRKNIRTIISLSNSGLDVGKINKAKIKKHNKKMLTKVLNNIETPLGLRNLLSFKFTAKIISIEKFRAISKNFFRIVKNLQNGVEVSQLYCHYGAFLNDISIFDFNADELEIEKLKLYNLWIKRDYDRCINTLETIRAQNKEFDVNQAIDQCNKEILSDPRNFGYISFSHNKSSFLTMLERGSETFYNKFCENIDIEKPFPKVVKIDGNDKLPKIILNEIKFYLNNFGYRMLNNYDPIDYLIDYYSEIRSTVSFVSVFFTKEKQLYNSIKKKFRKSKLLKWSDEPTYADLTQLFPLIENQILLNGNFNKISPLKNSLYSSSLKEPTTILLHRFRRAQELYGDLESVSDLIFVYLILFDKNCFNIRNKVIHGNEYPLDSDKLRFYRKLTLICIAIILKRNETEKN